MEGDVLPDPQILEVVLIRTSLQISARTLFTVESNTSCAKEDCKPERRRNFHQPMLMRNWLKTRCSFFDTFNCSLQRFQRGP